MIEILPVATDVPATSGCEGCGLCCLHMSVPPYDDEERELLQRNLPHVYADLLAVEATRDLQLRTVGTDWIPCGFFDMVTRRCRHHEYSPDTCGRFQAGGSSCTQFRADVGWGPVTEPAG